MKRKKYLLLVVTVLLLLSLVTPAVAGVIMPRNSQWEGELAFANSSKRYRAVLFFSSAESIVGINRLDSGRGDTVRINTRIAVKSPYGNYTLYPNDVSGTDIVSATNRCRAGDAYNEIWAYYFINGQQHKDFWHANTNIIFEGPGI